MPRLSEHTVPIEACAHACFGHGSHSAPPRRRSGHATKPVGTLRSMWDDGHFLSPPALCPESSRTFAPLGTNRSPRHHASLAGGREAISRAGEKYMMHSFIEAEPGSRYSAPCGISGPCAACVQRYDCPARWRRPRTPSRRALPLTPVTDGNACYRDPFLRTGCPAPRCAARRRSAQARPQTAASLPG
jgi:hypothetical protein